MNMIRALFLLLLTQFAFAQDQTIEGSYLTMGPTGRTRIAGMYGTFDAGVTFSENLGRTHYARFVRPHLSGSLGKQLSPRTALGIGGGLFDLVVMTAPLFGEVNYVLSPAYPSSLFLRGRFGYAFPLDNFGAETSLSFPVQGRDSETGGLFTRLEAGIRLTTRGGADLMPTLGYTFTSYTERSGSLTRTIDFRRLTLGLGTKF